MPDRDLVPAHAEFRGPVLKQELRALLETHRVDEIATVARGTRRALGLLTALTFDRDPAIGWRAVEAMGAATARVADDDPAAAREHLRRLHWLIQEESGGICWRAPEAMAEIVALRPTLFADFIPIVIHLLHETAEEDLAHFRPGILWAIGRLGSAGAAHVGDVVPSIVAALDHADPQVRGMAVWALGRIGCSGAVAAREGLRDDTGAVEVYEGGELRHTTVSEVTRRALGGGATQA
ncbi:MAG: HEAT repeat domain-containing protein [Gemmatimonadota bacterium]|nr:HEAT repeat domain-containing protein [Gemmatimonadota bacterium]